MRFKIWIILVFSFNILFVTAQDYKRIISLAPSVTKNIYLLDEQKKLVGCTSYCRVDKGDNISVIGNAVNVNLERILSLKPDMVITTELTSPETIAMLKKAGIPCRVFNTPVNFDGICEQFRQTAMIFKKNTQAEIILKREKTRLDSLKKMIAGKPKLKVFIELGVKPLFAVIPNTFMHDYIEFIGGINIATDASTGIISRESVLLKNPDVIFITTMGVTAKDEMNTWNQFKSIGAVKNKKIFILNSDEACTPCPDSFTNTVEHMIKFLYGKN